MAIAYNSQKNEYLVVWQNKESDICWQVVPDSGSVPDEHDFCIILISDNQQFPAVAYNSTNCQYLVVWQDDGDRDSIYLGWDIYGQLISCTPEPMGTPFPFFRPPGRAKDQRYPAVAYNKKDEYLVVWEDKWCPSSPYTVNDIYGWIVDSEGNLKGDVIPISTATDCESDESCQHNPAVAYNSQNNQYLVVWEDNRKSDSGYGWDIYGQVISTTGTLVGGNFPIIGIDKDQLHPDLAYSSQDNLYLVVWQDYRYGKLDIYGQRVKSDGTPYGYYFPISSSGSAKNPAVAYNGDHEYLVVWQDKRNGEDIYGQWVKSDDSLLGSECPISTVANDQEFPDVAYSQNNKYMVVWQDNSDIYGQQVGSTPTPTIIITPTPYRLYLPIIIKKYISPCNNWDFETGDLSCWTYDGELPLSVVDTSKIITGTLSPTCPGAASLSSILNDKPAGKYSARLGDPSLGNTDIPVGSAWMSQTVTVPSNGVLHLSFWYRMQSYDGQCIDKFEVRIRDTNGSDLQQILSISFSGDAGTELKDTYWQQKTATFNRADYDYAQETIQIYFSSANVFDTFWNTWTYVDDIVVTP
jgi:hypothetical protein